MLVCDAAPPRWRCPQLNCEMQLRGHREPSAKLAGGQGGNHGQKGRDSDRLGSKEKVGGEDKWRRR